MFGQIPDFTNGFEFLRRIWSAGGSLPGGGMMPGLSAMTPPMDLDEVDKRIHDLKAVEGWLQLNASLLRTTIQGLEVQRATLVALQTFGNALSPEAMQTAMENVARAANAPSTSPPHPFRPSPASETASETVSEAEADAANAEDDEDFDAPPEVTAGAAEGEEPEAAPSPESAGPAPLPPNASLWWDLLQQQFSQIAGSATAATAAPFGNLGGFGAMGGMGGTAAPGAEGVAPAARDNPAPNGKASPKPAAKRAGAKKPAAKKAATKAAKPATKTSATKKPSTKKPAAKAPAAPGTPKDSVE
ncbi:PhaM family polyhydroxyalkanoate granule multifunctional regulatory protein [Cupriavidus sp. KB_39]|uniref:PhaM family polyhydroxyalkanoate granule multifunctional regulatory protein n=1 Tax=Cupriavidus sp. KB_39 TaxID=3233036 RepID=UPI003F91D111